MRPGRGLRMSTQSARDRASSTPWATKWMVVRRRLHKEQEQEQERLGRPGRTDSACGISPARPAQGLFSSGMERCLPCRVCR